jgi:hypothetical protein
LYLCEKCLGTFERFDVAGQCPRCGVWACVRCKNCSFTAHANEFINNGNRCPKCGAVVHIPGAPVELTAIETVEATVNVPRVCSNCRHGWTAILDVSCVRVAEEPTRRARKKARKEAEAALPAAIKKGELNVSEQVLCAKCEHFSEDAKASFFPTGYAAGIRKRYRKDLKDDGLALVIFLGLAIAAFSVAIGAFFVVTDGLLLLAFGGLPLCGGLYLLKEVGGCFLDLVTHAVYYCRVSSRIRTASEDELLSLVVTAYRQASESLTKVPWANVLIKEFGSSTRSTTPPTARHARDDQKGPQVVVECCNCRKKNKVDCGSLRKFEVVCVRCGKKFNVSR